MLDCQKLLLISQEWSTKSAGRRWGLEKSPSQSSRGREPQPRSNHLQKDVLMATRLLSSTARLQHCLGKVKSSLLPRIYLSVCSLQRWKNFPQASPIRDRQLLWSKPKALFWALWETGLQGQAAAIKSYLTWEQQLVIPGPLKLSHWEERKAKKRFQRSDSRYSGCPKLSQNNSRFPLKIKEWSFPFPRLYHCNHQ